MEGGTGRDAAVSPLAHGDAPSADRPSDGPGGSVTSGSSGHPSRFPMLPCKGKAPKGHGGQDGPAALKLLGSGCRGSTRWVGGYRTCLCSGALLRSRTGSWRLCDGGRGAAGRGRAGSSAAGIARERGRPAWRPQGRADAGQAAAPSGWQTGPCGDGAGRERAQARAGPPLLRCPSLTFKSGVPAGHPALASAATTRRVPLCHAHIFL